MVVTDFAGTDSALVQNYDGPFPECPECERNDYTALSSVIKDKYNFQCVNPKCDKKPMMSMTLDKLC